MYVRKSFGWDEACVRDLLRLLGRLKSTDRGGSGSLEGLLRHLELGKTILEKEASWRGNLMFWNWLFLWTIAHSERRVRGRKARHDTGEPLRQRRRQTPRPWGWRSLLSRGQGVKCGLTKFWCSIKNQSENPWKLNSWAFYFLLLLFFCLKWHMQKKKKKTQWGPGPGRPLR